MGYVIRLADWIEKDVSEDQFIDLTGILEGTVDVYIESGVRGHTVVLNDDVRQGVTFSDLSYNHAEGELMLHLTSTTENDPAITLAGSSGEISIARIRPVGCSYYVRLDQPLNLGHYTLTFSEGTVEFDII